MQITYRTGNKNDVTRIAQLDYIASDGAVEYLFNGLIEGVSALQLLTSGLEQDIEPHTFRQCIVADSGEKVIGMALSYPASYHGITDELTNFLPPDRLEHFRELYSSRVEGSYFLDAMCVDEKHRGKGIGKSLLNKTKEKAKSDGYSQLSLIVFADNLAAITLYKQQGFKVVKKISLEPHALIPHQGGCLLMVCEV
ncbi:GNAT family N-acetyltransferase [Vibrio sonorensis]|uniref:GNAT family N-acetyltransferase n=1 Tax=Vibrio sonorensis TaxID=1004316 RepID=UPI0008DB2E91|nr:GNAT family N-acetyltransferase [Vibrio sonorensis]